MKLECLPERQREHNDLVHKKLRFVFWPALTLIVLAVLSIAALYTRGPIESETSLRVVGPDGSTIIGEAIPLTPVLLVTSATVPGRSQILAGSQRLPVRVMHAETVRAEKLTLLQVQAPLPSEVTTMRAAVTGEPATARSGSGRWEGTIIETPNGILEAQPAPNVGSAVPIYAKSQDRALLALTASEREPGTLLSVRQILEAFPEAKGH